MLNDSLMCHPLRRCLERNIFNIPDKINDVTPGGNRETDE